MHNLLPGDSPITTVSRELTAAKRVVLAWSRHAEQSPYVEGEIMHAFGERKLLPVRIEKWSWPAFLSSVQYVDMTPADEEPEAWRQIESRLQQAPRSDAPPVVLPAVTPRLAVPRSAGPVAKMAVAMLVLALLLAGALERAFRALLEGDMQALRVAQVVVLVLPVLAAVRGADCRASRVAGVALAAVPRWMRSTMNEATSESHSLRAFVRGAWLLLLVQLAVAVLVFGVLAAASARLNAIVAETSARRAELVRLPSRADRSSENVRRVARRPAACPGRHPARSRFRSTPITVGTIRRPSRSTRRRSPSMRGTGMSGIC